MNKRFIQTKNLSQLTHKYKSILFSFSIAIASLLTNSQLHAQGANAFGPNGLQDQKDSSSNTSSKKGGKSKKPSEENDFSIGQEGGGDGAPLDIPTQNETGDEFFTSEGQSTAPIPSGASAFGGGNNPTGEATKSGANSKPEQIVPSVGQSTQASPPSNQNPAALLPNANPTAPLQPSVTNAPPPITNALPPTNAPPQSPALPSATNNPPPQTAVAPEGSAQSEGATKQDPTFKVVIPDPSTRPDPVPNDFSGAPPVPGTMRQMADGEAPETYVVQRGDTLFDICDQLLDEKSYWPKLWSMNPFIRNPHFIFPSMKLRFYPGDKDTPPYLQVVSEDDVIPIDKGNLDESELVADQVPPSTSEAEIAKTQKPYIVEVIGPDQLADDLSDAFIEAGKRYRNSDSSIEVPGFIFGEEKEAKAYVLGGRYGEMSLAPGQRATLESSSPLNSGSLLTVLRKSREINDPVTGDFVGYLYYFVGNILVANQIEEDVYSAIVQSTRLTVRPEDIVVDYISTLRTVPLSSIGVSRSEIDASVVAFEYDNQLLGAQGQTVFIDKGSKDGVSPGMYFSIYQTPRNLSPDSSSPDLPEDYHTVGLMRVIDVTSEGSVGYILESSREVMLEDRTKKP